jgi:hypothetical protein
MTNLSANADYLSDEQIRLRVQHRMNQRAGFLIHLMFFVGVSVLVWFLWGLGNNVFDGRWIEFPWPLVVGLAWSAGLAGHYAKLYSESGRRREQREQSIRETMFELYGSDWSDIISAVDYRETRESVEQHFRQRAELMVHFSIFLFTNLAIWLVFIALAWIIDTPAAYFPWPLLVSISWGFGLGGHVLRVFAHGFNSASREQALQREVERERMLLYGEAHKAKRRPRSENLEAIDADSGDENEGDKDMRGARLSQRQTRN